MSEITRISKGSSSLLLLGIVIVTVFITLTGSHGILRLQKIGTELRALREKNSSLQQEVTVLNEKISTLKSNSLVLEKKAREELGLSRRGETVYIFSEVERER